MAATVLGGFDNRGLRDLRRVAEHDMYYQVNFPIAY